MKSKKTREELVDEIYQLNQRGDFRSAVKLYRDNPEVQFDFLETFEHIIKLPEAPARQFIANYDKPKKNQYFRHIEVPGYWSEKYIDDVAETKYPKSADGKPDYEWYKKFPTEEMDKWSDQEWDRRINGYWFYNNGIPTWITGDHYMFLNYYTLDDGTKPEYRDRDRKWFIFWWYCENDPRCYGYIGPKARRVGDTSKCLSILVNHTTSTELARNGIQSKDDPSAEEAFGKAIDAYLKYPVYFQVTRRGSDRPKKILECRSPSKRITHKTTKIRRQDALDSVLDYKATTSTAYDSLKLHRWLQDEGGKITTGAKLEHTWRVVKQCLRMGTRIVGKAMLPTTVEELDKKGGESYRKVWEQSAVETKLENRHRQTTSGLYRLFIPAEEAYDGFIDKYGMSVVHSPTPDQVEYLKEKYPHNDYLYEEGIGAREYIQIDLEGKRRDGTSADVAQFKRMYPQVVGDCFRADARDCLFDVEIIDNRIDELEMQGANNQPWGRFELVWENNERFTRVIARHKSNGRFKFSWMPPDELQNNVTELYQTSDERRWMPKNKTLFAIGCDPFDSYKKPDGRLSDAAIYAYRLFDPLATDDKGVQDMNQPYTELTSDNFFLEYLARPSKPWDMFEDVLMLSWFLGCQVMLERNKEGAFNHFIQAGMWDFLANKPQNPAQSRTKRPKVESQKDKGAYGSVSLRLSMEHHLGDYIYDHGHRCHFKSLLKQCRDYEPEKITQYDAFVGASLALVLAKRLGIAKNKRKVYNEKPIILARQYKKVGDFSREV